MTSVQGCKRPRQERLSAAPSVAPLDSFSPPELGDKLSDQPAGLSGTKSLANAPAAATSIPRYSKDDLQRILKAVLETQAPALALALALASVIFEVPWEKLKARSPDVYRGNSHMDCYNFC